MSGLEATNSPLPLPTQQPAPVACDSGPDPAAGVLQFSTGSYSALEGTGTRGARDIIVTRTQGSKGAVSVNFSAGGGTAMSGVDYDAPADHRAIRRRRQRAAPAHAQPAVQHDCRAGQDGEPDPVEPRGCATLGPQAAAVLTIQDDDGAAAATLQLQHRRHGDGPGRQRAGAARALAAATLTPANGAFTFGIPMPNGFPYDVRVATQPGNPLQMCTVTNGSGTVADADVTDVTVDCVTPPASGALDPSFGDAAR